MPDSDSVIKNYMKRTGFVSGQFWLLTCVWLTNNIINVDGFLLRAGTRDTGLGHDYP